MGWGSIDASKPVILVVGHNPASSAEIIDYMRTKGLEDKVEIGGICCTALETTRYSDKAKVIGPLSRQLFFVRAGIADVIVTDEPPRTRPAGVWRRSVTSRRMRW
jgi:acetyl-CoA decarbonylase/synthase complex subunit alpha